MKNSFEGGKGDAPLSGADKLAFRTQKRNYLKDAASGALSPDEMRKIPGIAASDEITAMPGKLPNANEVQGGKEEFRSAKRMYIHGGAETAFGVDVKSGKGNPTSPDDEITKMPGINRSKN